MFARHCVRGLLLLCLGISVVGCSPLGWIPFKLHRQLSLWRSVRLRNLVQSGHMAMRSTLRRRI